MSANDFLDVDTRLLYCSTMLFNFISSGRDVHVFTEALLAKGGVESIKDLTLRHIHSFVLEHVCTNNDGELMLSDMVNEQESAFVEILEFLLTASSCKKQ